MEKMKIPLIILILVVAAGLSVYVLKHYSATSEGLTIEKVDPLTKEARKIVEDKLEEVQDALKDRRNWLKSAREKEAVLRELSEKSTSFHDEYKKIIDWRQALEERLIPRLEEQEKALLELLGGR